MRLIGMTVMLLGLGLHACSVKPSLRMAEASQAPDYSQEIAWAALPFRLDSADAIPSEQFVDRQATAPVDIFFLHPTTYTGRKGHNRWNAPIIDPALIKRTDKTTILHQASIFNGAGKVYAPRYRQAHLHAYYTKRHKAQVQRSFDLAYGDVRAAFEYYLEHYNEGRPIIIASHSQGAMHAARLLLEFFDGTPLHRQLVVAYLVGMPIKKDLYQQIGLCRSAEEIGCFCSWRSYRTGYYPRKWTYGDLIAVTNPLSWTTQTEKVEKTENRGGVLRRFHSGIYPNLANAQVHQGMLWVDKPRFPGSFLLTTKNYHVADFNLFWVNVRNNAVLRSQAFLKKGS